IITQGGVDMVARQVVTLIRQACPEQPEPTLAPQESWESSTWHAFPTGYAPKIWVSERDTLINALNLYHSYSRAGRFAKAIVRVASPAIPGPQLLRTTPQGDLQIRLATLEKKVCAILGGGRYAISFATGTPGPHRKMTAQVSDRSH